MCYKCGNLLEIGETVETCPTCIKLRESISKHFEQAKRAERDGDLQLSMYHRRLAWGD